MLTFEIALWAGILVYCLALYPIEIAFQLTPAVEYFVRAALGIAGTTVCLFIACRREGYKNAEFNLKNVLIPILMVFALQQIVAPLLQYMLYTAGTAKELAEGISLLANRSAAPKWLFHVCMLLLDAVFFIPAMTVGAYFGSKKRQRDRSELLSKRVEG